MYTIYFLRNLMFGLFLTALTECSVRCRIKTSLDFTKCSACNFSIFPPFDSSTPVSSEVFGYCNKTFTVSRVNMEPYSKLISENLLTKILRVCCGRIANVSKGSEFKDMNQLNLTSIQPYDVIVPVLVPFGRTRLYGYYFVPLLEVRDGFFITKDNTAVESLQHFSHLLVDLWPLLVTMLLFALIAGFIMWLMETWSNEEEFSRSFKYGLLDGFWWSFISMTTVGYGDKTPKFLGSRMFSVVWILIGITVCSMFTASLTTGLMNLKNPPRIKMEGSKVGVLRGRFADAIFVTRSGGKIRESTATEIGPALLELVQRTKREEIKGFFLDTFTYLYLKKHLLKSNGHSEIEEFIKQSSKETEFEFPGERKERSVYGVLVKNKGDYDFFRYAVEDNKEELDMCKRWAFDDVLRSPNMDHIHFLSPSGNVFWCLSMGNVIVILTILCFGFVYEIIRCRMKTNNEESSDSKPGTKVKQNGSRNHALSDSDTQ